MSNSLVTALTILFQCFFIHAQDFTVNSTNDAIDTNPGDGICDDGTGNCTLRAAIIESNALGGAHTITLPAGTYALTIPGSQENASLTGDLDISSDISIVGASPQLTFIDADSMDRVFHILNGTMVAVTMVTIREGYVLPGNGGGILNEADLTISYSIIENCHAALNQGATIAEGFGGGIYNGNTLDIRNTTLALNSANGGRGTNGMNGGGGGGSTPGLGGGIFNGATATLTAENITVSGNKAIGGRSSGGSTNNGVFNQAGFAGSGSFGGPGGAAGGGAGGNATGDFSGGGGGGSSCLFGGFGGLGGYGGGGGGRGARSCGDQSGAGGLGGFGGGQGSGPCCSSGGGGGAGAGLGGGIFNNGGSVTLNSCTIAFNEAIGGRGANLFSQAGYAAAGTSGEGFGSGLFNRSGTFDLSNSIVSNNLSISGVVNANLAGTPVDEDIYGSFSSSNGHNLVFNPGSGTLGGSTTGNILNADPQLSPLALNGGEVSTHEILSCPASPAINAADQASAALLDQRDFPRNGMPDIGAFEGASALIDLIVTKIEPCLGDSTGQITITAFNGTAPYSFQWDAAANNQTTTTAVNLSTGAYSVTVTDGVGCIKDTTITIAALNTPIVDLGNDTTLCDGTSYLLDALNSGSNYLWSDNSVNQTLNVSTANVYSVIVTYPITGCSNSDTVEIFIEMLPQAGTDEFLSVCNSGGDVDLNTMLNTGITGGTWTETSQVLSPMFDPVTGTLGVSTSMSGVYTFDYRVPGIFCPADTSVMTVDVMDQPVAGPDNDVQVCSTDGIVDLNALLSAGVDPGSWTETTNPSSGQLDAANGTFDPISVNTGAYTFQYETDSVPHCPLDVALMTVHVIATPTIDLNVFPTEGCSPLEVEIVDLSNSDAGASYTWDLGDGFTSNDYALNSHVYSTVGCHDISLTIDNQGCVASYAMQNAVCIYPDPIADFSWLSSQVFTDNSEVPFINESTGAVSYTWSFGDGEFSNEVAPTHTYLNGNGQEYEVQLTAVSEHGCVDSLTLWVTLRDILLFYVPNAFTPNGDEFNNTFGPVMFSGFDSFDFRFEIYNRWGQLVFQTEDPTIDWDGTFAGKLVQDGVYSWKLSFGDLYTDERQQYVGSVTIMR